MKPDGWGRPGHPSPGVPRADWERAAEGPRGRTGGWKGLWVRRSRRARGGSPGACQAFCSGDLPLSRLVQTLTFAADARDPRSRSGLQLGAGEGFAPEARCRFSCSPLRAAGLLPPGYRPVALASELPALLFWVDTRENRSGETPRRLTRPHKLGFCTG